MKSEMAGKTRHLKQKFLLSVRAEPEKTEAAMRAVCSRFSSWTECDERWPRRPAGYRSILSLMLALPPLIRDKNRMR